MVAAPPPPDHHAEKQRTTNDTDDTDVSTAYAGTNSEQAGAFLAETQANRLESSTSRTSALNYNNGR